ncbi:MAG: TolB family protein [Solirubrobacteraceae bacterium]
MFAGRPHRNAPYDLYTVTTRGRHLRRLTTFGADAPAPCADGSIAFVHRGDVYLLSANGRHRYRRLTFTGARAPSCSPDSRLIAFLSSPHRSYAGTPGDLYVISRTGGRLRRLTSHHDQHGYDPTGVVGAAAFSPGGGPIAVTDQQIPSPQQQPPAPDAESFVRSTEYLEVVNLRGWRSGPSVHLGDNSFAGGFTTLGGVSWQPLPAQP